MQRQTSRGLNRKSRSRCWNGERSALWRCRMKMSLMGMVSCSRCWLPANSNSKTSPTVGDERAPPFHAKWQVLAARDVSKPEGPKIVWFEEAGVVFMRPTRMWAAVTMSRQELLEVGKGFCKFKGNTWLYVAPSPTFGFLKAISWLLSNAYGWLADCRAVCLSANSCVWKLCTLRSWLQKLITPDCQRALLFVFMWRFFYPKKMLGSLMRNGTNDCLLIVLDWCYLSIDPKFRFAWPCLSISAQPFFIASFVFPDRMEWLTFHRFLWLPLPAGPTDNQAVETCKSEENCRVHTLPS